jgi:hypothetical protein
MADGEAKLIVSSERQSTRGGHARVSLLIALEVRPQKAGFVVFDKPTQVLDWGTLSFRSGSNLEASVGKRVGRVLDQYAPSDLVLRLRRDTKARLHRGMRAVLRVISKEAKGRSIKMHRLSTASIREFFQPHGYVTKHEIASAVADLFPEIAWKLPPKRKAWQNERPRMVIFDATALGLTFLAKHHDSIIASEE